MSDSLVVLYVHYRTEIGLVESFVSSPMTTHDGTAIPLGTPLMLLEDVKPYRVSIDAPVRPSEHPVT